MSDSFDLDYDIATVAIFCAPTTSEEAAALMHRAVAALISVDGMDFFDDEDRDIFSRSGNFAPEWAKRPVYLEDAASQHALQIHHFWRPGVAYHYLALSPDSDVTGDDLEQEWRLLTAHMERLLPALTPDAALGFAQLPSAETDPVDYGSICLDQPKLTLAPWTFIRSELANEDLRRLLASQVGISTKAVADGLVITVVETPGERPDSRFSDMISANASLTYIDPLVDP